MLANSWQNITVSQFLELQELRHTPVDSLTERYIDIILLCSEYEVDVVEDMSLRQLTRLIKQLSWINTQPTKNHAKKFGEYSILPFVKITWGMFVDLEYYYSQDYVKNMDTICGILLRQSRVNEWGVMKYEPYDYDPKERGAIIHELPITSVYGLITSYLDYRNQLIDVKYANLFERPDDEEPELTGVDLKEYNDAKREEERFNKWSYEKITLGLSGDDITKMNNVFELPLLYVLNMLSMKAELQS